MRKEKKRRRPLLGAFDDPWRKLAAIVLAIGLWYYLDAQVTRKLEMQPQVLFNQEIGAVNRVYVSMSSIGYTLAAIQDGDSRVNLAGDRVELELEGPRHLIEQLEKDVLFQVQELAKNVITQGDESFITFRKEDLRHHKNPDFNELIKSMTPSTVRILLEQNDDKQLVLDFENIELYDVDDDLKDRIRKSKTTFDPPTLKIFGPEDKLQSINTKTRLFRGTFTKADVRDRSELEIQLERSTDDGLSWVQLGEQLPTATFEIEPDWRQYELPDVPVILDTLQVGAEELANYEVDPPVITVKIRATGALNQLLWNFRETITVDQEMVRKHARIRAFLTKNDLNKPSFEVRPTIELFTVNAFGGIEKIFVLDVDFKQDDRKPITIKKRKP